MFISLREYGHGTDWLVPNHVSQYLVTKQLMADAGITRVTFATYDAFLKAASAYGYGDEVRQ